MDPSSSHKTKRDGLMHFSFSVCPLDLLTIKYIEDYQPYLLTDGTMSPSLCCSCHWFVCTIFAYVHLGIVAAAGRRLCGRRQQRGAGRGRGLCWVRWSGRWAPGAATGGSGTPPGTAVLAWSAPTRTWTGKMTADYWDISILPYWARGGIHPGQVASQSQGWHTHTDKQQRSHLQAI